jgi:DNA-binding transcriptional ArsR family regulator
MPDSITPARSPDLTAERAIELADLFRLLGDASRLRIVASCLDAPVAVSAIAARLSLSLSLVSHHLRLLKAARIVRAERQGKHVFYAADDEHIRRVILDMLEHVAEARDEEQP